MTGVFDYIRTTNLCDDSHPKLFYTSNDQASHTQYTNPRDTNGRAHRGHGQVTPIQINDTMGFGRFATISEFSLVFICSADPGEAREGLERTRVRDTTNGNAVVDYTNFPPLSPIPTTELIQSMSPNDPRFPELLDENGVARKANHILYPAYQQKFCLLYTSPSPRDLSTSRMPSSA